MPDAVVELLVTEAAIDKLGARGITTHDARQVPRNAHVIVRNPHKASAGKRRLLIGRTDGGRVLTLVIERTVDPTTWLIVTGWESSPRERKLLRS
ncbi:MAG TPA: hypothetical protein VMD79_04710 [Solirubrobacteraceae bacterium]|jgi:uncharacterized DUF497 family protein|nr:hypothetical protein [Solirubrobacteraceae bacterium]